MNTWCVVYTHPLKEYTAKQHLQAQGFTVYLPQFKKLRKHARKVEEVLVPLFPRYLFVEINLISNCWRSINNTRGVSHVLMNNSLHPARVPEHIITDLKSQETSEGVVPAASLITFVKGEKVRILDGVFKDQEAIFEKLDDQGRAQLLLNFLGRETKILLPDFAVEAL